jgi:ornithine cyclodeaminase/alanine dehydrogenase-like protein (mu-crystallin family)
MIVLDAPEIAGLLSPADAVRAIEDALRSGFDPASDPARGRIPLSHGEFLIMPSEAGEFAGVKIVGVAPENPTRGLARIQASYLLFDSATLTPVAVLDGIAVTSLRTAAVSIAAVRAFFPQLESPVRVVMFGAGPAAVAHVATLRAVVSVSSVTTIGRAVSGSDLDAIAAADIIICATTARVPLFDPALVKDRAVVIAIGSHEPDARELDANLLGRSHVIVEDVATAMREAGDVIQAAAAGFDLELIPLARAVTDPESIPFDRPIVFKSTGMSWEDLVIAAAIVRARA